MTARFNTMYNGQLAYQEAAEAQQRGHIDDYTRLLPMYIQTNKLTATQGKSQYETAITKSEKAIKLHSIKKRPQTNGNKKKTPQQKEYLQRKEFNPYLRHAWLLLGKSQFGRGDFIEAASTFNYILRLYATQPEVASVAKAWLARCYVALNWPYDAEDVLDKMRRDSITPEGARERTSTQAAYYIATGQLTEAIPLVRQTVKHTKNKVQRSRLNFLVGQMQLQLGNDQEAYKSFQRVIRSNPPYELQFNARIKQTEVLAKGKGKSMIKKLQRMAKNDKNKDYLDQVYYAIGNIYLAQNDTLHAIGAYEKGAEESTKNGTAKAVLLLRLSQIYWEQEKYVDAQRTYSACVVILDREHEL
ncbi:MAG: tetratricopeptide repeat protein, partial [Bacteroidaceae bacterium]|nr:tetratricopeptide repeat protein [Bacteroidaceae bacterium]